MTVVEWYTEMYDEDARLGGFSMEWLRTTHLISRILPSPPAKIADVAGGTGRYATWLASQGYEVSLLDLVPRHVERAQWRAQQQGVQVDCVTGDALALPWADESFDVVMVMGALYHLLAREDRLACLDQAKRVLKPGGWLVTAYIGRWAALFDGYRSGFVTDPGFRHRLANSMATGSHENPDRHPQQFTTAYFHTPDEIAEEVTTAGFVDPQVLPVEGFTSLIDVPEAMQSGDGLSAVMGHLTTTETIPSLRGASAHLLCLSRRPVANPRSS
ncbi:MAG: class I SAM-dependent methyltransferase [Propionibacteriaceae bacterium]|jgi:ubiquinone/menaquinone biosynthesis C-methylase UbiE|nr:class I SAM-dependent methyltransferase [Propionibacteriaceae bacterium]